ncbi:hypothetical protein RIF29_14805 [Crotalaria pallida]|uniref:C3H1-type domain-containing protein n=1 Tax=Crotalaria pallida TaxID=3830 RepID=A0AAN9IC03_CROPI
MNDGVGNTRFKTQLCRKYSKGVCYWGSKCNYAHSIQELKPPPQQQLCRMFLHNNQCSYGHTCRFLHVHHANPNLSHAPPPPQPQPLFGNAKLERVEGYSSAKCNAMQTSTAATNVSTSTLHKNEASRNICPGGQPVFANAELQKFNGYSSAICGVTQTSTTATNVSPTSSLYKYEQDGFVKFIFKKNDLQKISGIYADWI